MNWDNFWLNEGFVTFLVRKNQKTLEGEKIQKMTSSWGNMTMFFMMQKFGMTHKYTSLTPQAGQNNPMETYSFVPYEKGYQFLVYLESLTGELDF